MMCGGCCFSTIDNSKIAFGIVFFQFPKVIFLRLHFLQTNEKYIDLIKRFKKRR